MLSAAWVPREVWIIAETAFGDKPFGPFLTRPPTVDIGLAVSESFEQAQASGFDNPGAFAVLRHALRAWLPVSASSLLLGSAIPRRECYLWAMHHLALGAEDRAAYRRAVQSVKEGGESFKETPADSSWSSAVAEYRTVYRCSYAEVMAEPWLAFIWQLEYIERQRARASVDLLRGSPESGSKAVSRLFKTAYPVRPLTEAEQMQLQEIALARMRADLGANDTSNFHAN